MLPPGLFRDCCCTRRIATQVAEKDSVRSCCKARQANAVKSVSQNRPKPGWGLRPQLELALHQQQCQCRIQSANTAILASDQRVMSGSDLHVVGLAVSPLLSSFRLDFTAEQGHIRSWHYLDPPLRKTLCRWVI
jgi:hypothetical protein